jgi:hypothetical protein
MSDYGMENSETRNEGHAKDQAVSRGGPGSITVQVK